jgi:gamma-glutamylputrescine oxidase
MQPQASSGHVASYYAASASSTPQRPTLEGDVECDVCVVGAGFTGISAALHLAERGHRVVVLESVAIGFGASGRNGGQIVNSYSRDMDVIEKQNGAETARALGAMAFEGNQIIRQRIEKYQIDCDLKEDNLFAACNKKQWQGLKEQNEPPRLYRRLHILRGWSYELTKTIFPRSPGASCSISP